MRVSAPTPSRLWAVPQVVLAAALGASVGASAGGWSVVPAWAPSLIVLTAALLGIWRSVTSVTWAWSLSVLLALAVLIAAGTGERRLEAGLLAASSALAHASVVALAVGLASLARRRRHHRSQGWELARSLAREEQARTDAALVRERAAMAAEIHDTLGHRLTLVSVQLGGLSLDPTLPPAAQAAVEQARLGVGDAAADLGETVQLLTMGEVSRTPDHRALTDIVGEARAAGVHITEELSPGLENDLLPHAHAALARVLSEALANAAKHAPGQTVHVTGGVEGGSAVLTVSNADDPRQGSPAGSSGHGLPSLRHRLHLLGGTLEVVRGTDHVVRATLPTDANPQGLDEPSDVEGDVLAAQRSATMQAREARRLTWAVPAALAAGATLTIVCGFLYLSITSVLRPDDFARVEVGMSQREAQEILPGFEMIEAPRGTLPEPTGASCVYHEESVSLLSREDVFRICFVEGVVIGTDVVPGG